MGGRTLSGSSKHSLIDARKDNTKIKKGKAQLRT